MKSKIIPVVFFLALACGCADQRDTPNKPRSFEVTIPNGSSPEKAHAPHAPANDDLRFRNGWNHGNGVLWVWLNPEQFIVPESDVRKDGSIEIKFGWWRGIPGNFSISGRRLDAPAPPLRYSTPPVESYGAFGFLPSGLIFPTDGYWEITGHIDDQSLKFVVHVLKQSS